MTGEREMHRATPQKRVGLFVFGYGVWNSPSLLNAATVLAEQGWHVDIFTDVALTAADLSRDPFNVDVHFIGHPSSTAGHAASSTRPPSGSSLRRRFRHFLPGIIDRALLALWIVGPRLVAFILGARRITRSHEYGWFIGAETTGLAAAVVLGAMQRVPVVYWSLELWLWRETHTLYYRLLKLLEYLFHNQARFTIIPSADWVPLLASENGVSPSSFFVVPATARGPGQIRTSDYLQRKLAISPSQRVILYAGSLVDWALIRELADATNAWPHDWVLVLHGWGDHEYLETVRTVGPRDGRLRFSQDIVPHHELDDLIWSADVGIALYKDDVMARRLITSASSKVGQYLKCGVPVVVNDFSWFRTLFSRYACGVPVKRTAELRSAITTIFEKHDDFRTEAVRCFREQYDFDVHFAAVLRRLEAGSPQF